MLYQRIVESASYLRDSLAVTPKVALILGSGLGDIADKIEGPQCVRYGSVPYMVQSTVEGHEGRFVAGTLSGKSVICMQGRLHAYEGYSARDVAYPVYVMRELGVDTLIITNAAGGIDTSYRPGDIMMITDHINFTGMNPLIGPSEAHLGPRYNDMTFAYTPALQQIMRRVAASQHVDLREGVYLGCLGPSFETPAEIRAFRTLGADAVGMSTVFEVIAAANCGLGVVALSLITNMAAGVLEGAISSEEVDEIGARKAAQMCGLICGFLQELD